MNSKFLQIPRPVNVLAWARSIYSLYTYRTKDDNFKGAFQWYKFFMLTMFAAYAVGPMRLARRTQRRAYRWACCRKLNISNKTHTHKNSMVDIANYWWSSLTCLWGGRRTTAGRCDAIASDSPVKSIVSASEPATSDGCAAAPFPCNGIRALAGIFDQ